MFDFSQMIEAQMSNMREKRLEDSYQLSLWELKLKLELVADKSKEIVFDFWMRPAGASSWRGSYRELGLEYSEQWGGQANWNSDRISYENGEYKSYEQDSFELREKPTVKDFLEMLNSVTGKVMVGYKWGDFTMNKNVSVYFGNYGGSSVSNYKGIDYATVVPIDILEWDEFVVVVTEAQDY